MTDNPFKAPSPTRKQSGVGDFYGTLGGKIPYVEVGLAWYGRCVLAQGPSNASLGTVLD